MGKRSIFTRILPGTLDAYSQADVARSSANDYARVQYHDELLSYPSPRTWWRIEVRPDGVPIGLVVPAQSPNGFVIAYLGVIDGHRGQGFVNDLLAERTQVLAAQGAERVTADTDLGNQPMARAFERAGYVNFAGRIDMRWGPAPPNPCVPSGRPSKARRQCSTASYWRRRRLTVSRSRLPCCSWASEIVRAIRWAASTSPRLLSASGVGRCQLRINGALSLCWKRSPSIATPSAGRLTSANAA